MPFIQKDKCIHTDASVRWRFKNFQELSDLHPRDFLQFSLATSRVMARILVFNIRFFCVQMTTSLSDDLKYMLLWKTVHSRTTFQINIFREIKFLSALCRISQAAPYIHLHTSTHWIKAKKKQYGASYCWKFKYPKIFFKSLQNNTCIIWNCW